MAASAESLRERAREFVERGAFGEAITLFRDALPLVEAKHGADSLNVAGLLNELGVACKFGGAFDEADTCYTRAMRIAEETEGTESDLVATLLHNIGGLAHSRREFAAGLEPARRGLAIRESLHGPDEQTVGADAAALAALLEGLEEYEEAEALYKRGVAILDAAGDAYHAAMARNGLGSTCQAQERYDEARAHYGTALVGLELAVGPEHPDVGFVLNNLATLHRRLGEDTEARALLTRAHDLLDRTLGPDHPVTQEIAGNRRRVDASPSPYV